MNALKITPYEYFLVKSMRIHFCDTPSMNRDEDYLTFFNTNGMSTSDYLLWDALNFDNLNEVLESCSNMAKDFFNLHMKLFS